MGKTVTAVSLDAPPPMERVSWDEIIRIQGSDPAELMLRREGNAVIQRVLDSLPAEYRAAIVLSDIEGHPDRSVSKIMLCPLETARSRIQHGRILMKKALEEIEKGGKIFLA